MTSIIQDQRARANAWMLDRVDAVMHRLYGGRKQAIYGTLPNRLVEIGAGAGANLRYYVPHTRLIAIEPNRAMHPLLRDRAVQHSIALEIHACGAEQIDLPDRSVEAVIGTLVLCSVQHPEAVVGEVLRILRPEGRYIFLEHVAALPGSSLRGVQQILLRPWRWLFEGCHLNRDSHAVIASAGFGHVQMNCFAQSRLMPFAPHIFGVAIK